MANTTFRATTKWTGEGLHVVSKARGFEVSMDEPESLGGTNVGMNPVELLLSALGGCMAVLVPAFAAEHGLQIDDVSISLEGDLDPDGFLGRSDVRPGFQDIRVKLNVKSPEPRERIEELMELVFERCPVKDTLCGVPVSETYTLNG